MKFRHGHICLPDLHYTFNIVFLNYHLMVDCSPLDTQHLFLPDTTERSSYNTEEKQQQKSSFNTDKQQKRSSNNTEDKRQ